MAPQETAEHGDVYAAGAGSEVTVDLAGPWPIDQESRGWKRYQELLEEKDEISARSEFLRQEFERAAEEAKVLRGRLIERLSDVAEAAGVPFDDLVGRGIEIVDGEFRLKDQPALEAQE